MTEHDSRRRSISNDLPEWWGDERDPRYLGFHRARSYDRAENPLLREEEERYRSSRYARHLRDLALRQAVIHTLSYDLALRADKIEVEVEDGVVTLSGEVGDYLEARYAWDDAWETPGVRGVISRVEVRAETENP